MEVGIKLDWTWYVPDYKNNRELKEEEQLMIEIMPLDHNEKVKVGKRVKTFIPGGTRPGKKYAEETNATTIAKETFIEKTREVKNCVVNGIEVITGKELYEADGVDSDLIIDITNAIYERSILEAGLIKNS